MTRTVKTIVSALIFLGLAALIETYAIGWLFPWAGLAGLICIPVTIIFGILSGVIFYNIARGLSLKYKILFFSFLLFLQTIFLMLFHPQDSAGGSTFEQIGNYINTYRHYNEINFEKFPTESVYNNPDRVAYIYKFKEKLPEKIITLTLDTIDKSDGTSDHKLKYIIHSNKNTLSYDASKIEILNTDSGTVIIEKKRFNRPNKYYRKNWDIRKVTAGGYYDKLMDVMVYQDDLKLEAGTEKVFYKILTWTK